MRPGEKLFEELFNGDEPRVQTYNSKISIAQVAEADDDFLLTKIEQILGSLYKLSEEQLIAEMKEIVPGYTSRFEFTEQSRVS